MPELISNQNSEEAPLTFVRTEDEQALEFSPSTEVIGAVGSLTLGSTGWAADASRFRRTDGKNIE